MTFNNKDFTDKFKFSKGFKFELDFEDYGVKGRDSKGNIVSKHTIAKVSYKEKSTISSSSVDDINKIEVNDESELPNDEPQTKLF